MGNTRRSVVPASIVATAVLAASVSISTMPPHVASTRVATLTSPAPQTLQVRLAGLVEQAIEDATAMPSAANDVESAETRKSLTSNASVAAVRPPVGYSPFYPFTTPTTPQGSLGWWVTLPIAIPGLVFDSLAQSFTRELSDRGLDARLANQPELLSRYLLVPIAVTIQTALTGLIGGGTVELGKFTLPQAVFWSARSLRTAIANTIAAEKDLLSGGTGVLPEDESVAADKRIALSASAPATVATATTKPKVAQRPVAPAHTAQPPTSTPPTGDTADDAETDASVSRSLPTAETPAGHTNRFRLGPISLPSPFRAGPASPSADRADSDRRGSISVKSAASGRK